jgi:hypothetical protein
MIAFGPKDEILSSQKPRANSNAAIALAEKQRVGETA